MTNLKIKAKNYRARHIGNIIPSIVLFVLISALSLILISFIGGSMALLALFIIIPAYFSLLYLSMMEVGPTFPIKEFFISFKKFYNRQYFSSFRVVKALLKSAIISIIASFVFSLVGMILLFVIPSWNEFLNEVQNVLTAESLTIEALEAILYNHQEVVEQINLITSFPPIVISMVAFAYYISLSSGGFFTHYFFSKMPSLLAGPIYEQFYKNNKKNIRKDYWKLNYPFVILFAIGAIGGGYLSYFLTKDAFVFMSFAAIGGIVMSSFYIPYLISNNYAIYKCHYQKEIGETAIKLLAPTFLINSTNQEVIMMKEFLELFIRNADEEE